MAVHPSDLCVTLAALDAEVLGEGASGPRRIPFAEFHRLPGDQAQLDTTLRPGELIVALKLPPLPLAQRSTYRKVRERASYASHSSRSPWPSGSREGGSRTSGSRWVAPPTDPGALPWPRRP
ncbi:FAD binding domain-containing protein [Deinococcus daejeonensis]|uniref:FAD binding domain-containing protein n=1 Tax=Deinococcus daejeonensis TaxID=1007098 RepID=UPI001E3CBE0A|nr:FAD binding domain-containing protein [Deinococcus daejeonensis]